VPSFVADFIQVIGWVDENGNNIGSIVDKQGTLTTLSDYWKFVICDCINDVNDF